MKKQIICLLSLVVIILGHRNENKKLNFEELGNIVRFYRTASFCEHETDIKTQHDDDGRLSLSYQTTIRQNESDDDLCKCMWRYLNQNCWLKNVKRKCVVKGKQLTMYVTGPPNPDFNPLEPFPKVTAPISALADLMDYYPSIEIAGHWCSSTHKKLDNGQTCLTFQCKLTPLSPKQEKVCATILEQINQCDWLGTLDHNCNSKDGKLFFEINGK